MYGSAERKDHIKARIDEKIKNFEALETKIVLGKKVFI
jgi:hypothetical protein